MSRKIPEDRLWALKRNLDRLPPRSPDRRAAIEEMASLYGVSPKSVYRALRQRSKPHPVKRSDAGVPRVLSKKEMERYCQLIAAMKLRTLNGKGHHLSTDEAIRLLVEFGLETSAGLVKAPTGVLKRATVNRYLRLWRLDLGSLQVEPPSVRFQAKHANDCWQFDLSPSDLKELEVWPEWIKERQGRPLLMIYSIVDDRSGVIYQEYHVTMGEDVEAALRFLYRAMAPKSIDGFPFEGIPAMIYMDNGPIRKSGVFQRVMEYMGIEIRAHMPKGKDGRRTTARSKGKVERPFRTVKDNHESLYHFHKPKDVKEANEWLLKNVLRYNERPHRSEPHSRIEDWIANLPASGVRKVCHWERFTTFAREPERRKVRADATVNVEGVAYQLAGELAGETVVLWWGLFDGELFVEHGEERFGPYHPVEGPIPLHRYRKLKKTKKERQADSIADLAKEIALPKEAMTKDSRNRTALARTLTHSESVAFRDPDPFHEFTYPSAIAAKKAIADYLGIALARMTESERVRIDELLETTLQKAAIFEQVRAWYRPKKKEKTDAQ